MLVSSFVRLSRQEAGFRSERVWAGGIGLPPAQYPDPATRAVSPNACRRNCRPLPASKPPRSRTRCRSPEIVRDRLMHALDGNPVPVNQRPLGLTRSVSPGYFRTLGIPLLSGRDFTEQDKVDSRLVVILSNSTAKKLFPNENPIGHQILFGTDNGNGLPAEVIGVVGDVRSQELSKSNDVEFYRPWPQRSAPFLNVVVRSATKPEATAGIVPLGPEQDRPRIADSATEYS